MSDLCIDFSAILMYPRLLWQQGLFSEWTGPLEWWECEGKSWSTRREICVFIAALLPSECVLRLICVWVLKCVCDISVYCHTCLGFAQADSYSAHKWGSRRDGILLSCCILHMQLYLWPPNVPELLSGGNRLSSLQLSMLMPARKWIFRRAF